ncbi:SLC13 family permease [Amphritea balenae]|uniref:TRAP transporter large permease subunit n=1 Tax=Amphritea balenae TaxID=452629 RepID=A0A3P1SSY5_9GAMM|nr:SLC13 family permease [Amphritea balenae]RRD00170.1 TRAP transporter large permease subunit [Amphritea balenae]GGK77227.1 sodium:sulfate symporter [Amphritea balenae]
MDFSAVLTLLLLVLVLLLLVFSRVAADMVLLGAMAVLIVAGVLTPAEALVGFSNPGVITIAAFYVIAAGLKETGAVRWIGQLLLGLPAGEKRTLVRVIIPSSLLSAFMNNTAVVAMFIPAVQDWAKRLNTSVSKLLIPLSYAAILGGTCTLIGTSTNLVVDGLLQVETGQTLGMFDLAWVGIPVLIIAAGVMVLLAPLLLPARKGVVEQLECAREYVVELAVMPAGPLVGKTVIDAGLRQLTYGYLVDIKRGDQLLTAIAPDMVLSADDVLVFIGAAEAAHELRAIRGLTPSHEDIAKLDISMQQRCLVEAVIGPEFVALGQTVRDSRFRSRFQAAILSVCRQGYRLDGKIGDIQLQTGDTLLLEASEDFVSQYRSRRDFLLISALNESTPPDYDKAPIAVLTLLLMVVVSASGLLSILESAIIAAGAILLTGCVSIAKARRNVDLSVLLVIAASFALGAAMVKTGNASMIAEWLLFYEGISAWQALIMMYLITAFFTELITNNAAAVLMFPVAMALAEQLGVSYMPFVIAVMFAASASFITPLGYQTNLMVYGPGGYRFTDYARLGVPMSLTVAFVSLSLIPQVWSF